MPKKKTLLQVIELSERGEYVSSEDESTEKSSKTPAVRGAKSLEVIAESGVSPPTPDSQSQRGGVRGRFEKLKMSGHHHLSLGSRHKHDKHDKQHRHSDDDKSVSSTSSKGKKKHKFGLHLGKKKSDSSQSVSSSSSSSESGDEHGDGGKKKKKKRSKARRMASEAKDNIKKIFKRKKKKKKGSGSSSSGSDSSSDEEHEEHQRTTVAAAVHVASNGNGVTSGSQIDTRVEAPAVEVQEPTRATNNSPQTKRAMFDQLSGRSRPLELESNAAMVNFELQGNRSVEVGVTSSLEQPEVTIQRTGSNISIDSHKSDKSSSSKSSKSSKGSSKSSGSNRSASSGRNVTASYDVDAPPAEENCDLEINVTNSMEDNPNSADVDMTSPVLENSRDGQIDLSGSVVADFAVQRIHVDTPDLDDGHVDLEIDMTGRAEQDYATRSSEVDVSNLDTVAQESDVSGIDGSANLEEEVSGSGGVEIDVNASTPLVSENLSTDDHHFAVDSSSENGEMGAFSDQDATSISAQLERSAEVHHSLEVDVEGNVQNGETGQDTVALIGDGKNDFHQSQDTMLTSSEMKKKVAKEKKVSGVPWSEKEEGSGEKTDGATRCCFCWCF